MGLWSCGRGAASSDGQVKDWSHAPSWVPVCTLPGMSPPPESAVTGWGAMASSPHPGVKGLDQATWYQIRVAVVAVGFTGPAGLSRANSVGHHLNERGWLYSRRPPGLEGQYQATLGSRSFPLEGGSPGTPLWAEPVVSGSPHRQDAHCSFTGSIHTGGGRPF